MYESRERSVEGLLSVVWTGGVVTLGQLGGVEGLPG